MRLIHGNSGTVRSGQSRSPHPVPKTKRRRTRRPRVGRPIDTERSEALTRTQRMGRAALVMALLVGLALIVAYPDLATRVWVLIEGGGW